MSFHKSKQFSGNTTKEIKKYHEFYMKYVEKKKSFTYYNTDSSITIKPSSI